MKTNKGIIGLGLIVAIVLGIVVVGGGAYYYGTKEKGYRSDDSRMRDGLEKNYPDNPEFSRNLPLVENQKVPIKIISPNGGEVYKSNDKIGIKWNGAVKDNIAIYLKSSDAVWCFIKDVPSNTTSYIFTPLGHNCTNGKTISGGQYKITLIAYEKNGMTPEPGTAFAGNYNDGENSGYTIDSSDNSFTINSATGKATPVTGEYGDDINGRHIGYIKSINSQNELSIDYVQWINSCVTNTQTSYCMNGYDVVNNNTQLRSFGILNTAQVKLQTYSHDSSGSFKWNQVVSLSIFKNALNTNILYWITLKDGKVIEITEQYQP